MHRLALIALVSSFAVPPPTVPVTVHRQACPDDVGGACADLVTGDIYLDGNDKVVLAHELGHFYLENLDGFWKGAIAVHVTRGNPEWTARTRERAADAYAACALRMRRGRNGLWESFYGYQPTPRQHRQVCSAIRRSSRASPGIGRWRTAGRLGRR